MWQQVQKQVRCLTGAAGQRRSFVCFTILNTIACPLKLSPAPVIPLRKAETPLTGCCPKSAGTMTGNASRSNIGGPQPNKYT